MKGTLPERLMNGRGDWFSRFSAPPGTKLVECDGCGFTWDAFQATDGLPDEYTCPVCDPAGPVARLEQARERVVAAACEWSWVVRGLETSEDRCLDAAVDTLEALLQAQPSVE